MSKIELPAVTGNNNTSRINDNFKKIEDALNQEILYRKGYTGEPNEMETNLDMNSNRILNLPDATSPAEPVTLKQLMEVDSGNALVLKPQILESLRRSYAEAGFNLVIGSFELGGTVTTSTDVLLYEANGKAYSYNGTLPHTIPSLSNPSAEPGMWVDVSTVLLKDKLGKTIANYSGDANYRVSSMIADVGFAVFPEGETILNTATIDAPIYFNDGAYITVPVDQTITVNGRISSARQQIFAGPGSVLLRNDVDSGEDSRNIHASWFGVFPVNDAATDMAPNIAKMFSALDNSREAVVDFDIGRYPIGSEVTVPRATFIRGAGSRRTIFEVLGNGYDVFTAQANGVRFKGIQFELSDAFPTAYRNSGWFINSNQQLVELDDVWVGRASNSIMLSGGKSTAKHIRATFEGSVDVGLESCVVCIEGSDAYVEDVVLVGDGLGPSSIISVGGSGLNNITSVIVTGVRSNCKSVPVSITAKSKIISGVKVNDLNYRGLAGFEAPGVVVIETTGTGSIEGVSIDGAIANDKPVNGVRIKQGSSGSTRKVSVCNTKIIGGSGVGVKIERTSGTLDGVTVDQTVDVLGVATPFQRIGAMSNVSISPVSIKDTNFPISYDATVADDAAYSVAMPSNAFTGFLMVSVGFTEYVIAVARAVSTAQITSIAKSAGIDVSTAILTGTTGTDGRITVSSSAGAIYVENRSGSSQRISITLMYGVK